MEWSHRSHRLSREGNGLPKCRRNSRVISIPSACQDSRFATTEVTKGKPLMIPQAIASAGPYADLWSHLKSMQHALGRALGAQTAKYLSDLDKERLNALARFLKSELSQKTEPDALTFSGFRDQPSNEPTYSLDIDLQQMLKNLPAFEEWHAAQKLGFEKKWQKLVSALETYLQSLGSSLLPIHPPQEEFGILQKIVSELLVHAESALQT